MEKSKECSHFCDDQNMQKWLEEVFQNDIPSFDGTPEFFDTLKTIMAGNEFAEKDAKAMIKAERTMKNFYDEKAEELQLVTDFIRLNSEPCRRVERLALLAEKMKLEEPSLTNFLLGMAEIEDQESVAKEKEIFTEYHTKVFRKKTMHTIKMNEKLKRNLKSLSEVVEKQKTHYPEIDKEVMYFTRKKGELNETIKKNQEVLKNAGYKEEEGIRHSVLVEEAQKQKELEEHLKALENKLQAYHSLTPNFTKTARAVKDKEEELIKLEADLQLLLKVYDNL